MKFVFVFLALTILLVDGVAGASLRGGVEEKTDSVAISHLRSNNAPLATTFQRLLQTQAETHKVYRLLQNRETKKKRTRHLKTRHAMAEATEERTLDEQDTKKEAIKRSKLKMTVAL